MDPYNRYSQMNGKLEIRDFPKKTFFFDFVKQLVAAGYASVYC